MPITTIPLIGQPTQRGVITSPAFSAGQDQRFINCMFYTVVDDIQQQQIIYAQKRAGLEVFSTPASGASTGQWIFIRPFNAAVISVFLSSGIYSIYSGTTNCGAIDSAVSVQMNEAIFNGIGYVIFTTTAGTGWFLPSDAVSGFTFTGDTHTNTTIDNVSSLTGLYVGQLITGTGIQSNTRIASITAPSTITITLATVSSNSGITITRSGIAKIINANFPTSSQGMVEMDGYVFTADTANQRIYNSNINDIVTWTANNYISVIISSDGLGFVGKYKNRILGVGSSIIEQFFNAGNSSGSILSSDKNSTIQLGGANGITQTNDYLFFGGSAAMSAGIWVLSSDGVKKISPPPIDRDLDSTLGSLVSSFWSIFYGGYTWFILFTISGQTFFYCVELKIWSEMSFTSGIAGANSLRSINNTTGPIFVGTGSAGNIYKWDATPTYQDNGSTFSMIIQTQPFYLNKGLPFVIDNISLIADTQSSGSTLLESTADDYASFGTIGSFDITQQQKNLSGGGYYDSSCAFRLTDSGNNPWRGQALQVTWRPCQ